MATNMNMTRKPNLGLNEFPGAPVVSLGDYMSMGKNVSSPNFPMALSNNQMPHNNERAMMGPTSHNPFSPNVYGQASNSFGVPSRQFENPVELARQKFSPLANSNMASNSPYSGHYVPPNGSESEQFSMNRFSAKYRNQEMFNVNKSLEQESYAQATQRSMTCNPWTAEYTGRNNRRHVPAKGLPLDQQVSYLVLLYSFEKVLDKRLENHRFQADYVPSI